MKQIYKNPDLQRKWEEAVAYLRAGRGWVADGKVGFRLPVAVDPEAPKFADRVTTIATAKGRRNASVADR